MLKKHLSTPSEESLYIEEKKIFRAYNNTENGIKTSFSFKFLSKINGKIFLNFYFIFLKAIYCEACNIVFSY